MVDHLCKNDELIKYRVAAFFPQLRYIFKLDDQLMSFYTS